MNARTIERIGCFLPLGAMITGFGGFALLFGADAIGLPVTSLVPIVAVTLIGLVIGGFVSGFVFPLLLALVPAHCYVPGCKGRMRRHWELGWFQGHVIYTCERCRAMYVGWISWNTGDGGSF